MDNASFHKDPKIRAAIEGAGCFLEYLPPYSPDFNPIEKQWGVIKDKLRKILNYKQNLWESLDSVIAKM